MTSRLKSLIGTILLLVCGSFSIVYAQGTGNLSGLDLSLSAVSPNPGQEITITAKSYSLDINGATITWTSGGKTLGKGVGLTSLVVKAPSLGKTQTINVTAASADGTTYRNSIVITSSSVDMVVESDGFVPPLFRGKAPVAYQNKVKVTAIPHLANSSGVEYDPVKLVYKWEQSTKVLESGSGYGRQSVTIPGSIIPRPYIINVTVTTPDGSVRGTGSVSVVPDVPSVELYRTDSLYGPLYNSAAGNTIYLGTQRETGVTAAPYGFNVPESGVGTLSLAWVINNIVHPELAGNKTVTLRAPDNTSGQSSVHINVLNGDYELQQGSAGFTAIFNSGSNQ